MMKKALTLLLAASLLALSSVPAFAAADDNDATTDSVSINDKRDRGDKDRDEGKVELKTKKTAAVVEGDTAWVAFSWKAKGADATEFKIVAETDAEGVTIAYPTNTDTYSSLMDNDTLSAGEIDFTSLRVSVPYGSKKVKLKVTATWVQNGESQEEDYKITVPVAKFRGDDIAQATKDSGVVSATSPAWLEVEWTGLAPILEDVEITVNGPAGATITYPADRAFTSLYYNNSLEDGETDVARFLVDASTLTPGTYSLSVEVSYTKGGRANSVVGDFAFEVTS
jgi:hypothetical protein